MAELEEGYRWWLRYVIVPLVGGGGVIALIIAVIGNGQETRKAEEDTANLVADILDNPDPMPVTRRFWDCLLDNELLIRGATKRLTDDGLSIVMTSSHTDKSIRDEELSFRLSGPVRAEDKREKMLIPEGKTPKIVFHYSGIPYEVSTTVIENHKARFTIVKQGKNC